MKYLYASEILPLTKSTLRYYLGAGRGGGGGGRGMAGGGRGLILNSASSTASNEKLLYNFETILDTLAFFAYILLQLNRQINKAK